MIQHRAELLLEGQRLPGMPHRQTISAKMRGGGRKGIPHQEDFLEGISRMGLRDAHPQLLVGLF